MNTIKLDRAATGFQLKLTEELKRIRRGSGFAFLKYYQNVTREFMRRSDVNARGLLCYYSMGLGKSLLAVSIAVDAIDNPDAPRDVIVLLSKSLQENFKGAIRKYAAMRPDYYLGRLSAEDLNAWIDKKFNFVSMNASNMITQMRRAAEGEAGDLEMADLDDKLAAVLQLPSLDGKLVLVDEAHNLFRAITNGSKNALAFYDAVMKTRDLKLLFLTGTPVAADPFELAACYNMLGSRAPGQITLPDSYQEFKTLFCDENGYIKNKEKFQNRIMGLTSYVTHKSTPGQLLRETAMATEDEQVRAALLREIEDSGRKAEFPVLYETIVRRCEMTPDQHALYKLARDKEKNEAAPAGKGKQPKYAGNLPPPPPPSAAGTKPRGGQSSSYRVRSRQLSNYAPPRGYAGEKDPRRIPAISSPKFREAKAIMNEHAGQLGLLYSQFTGIGGLGAFSAYLEQNGWTQYIPAASRIGGETESTAELTAAMEEGEGEGKNADTNKSAESGPAEAGVKPRLNTPILAASPPLVGPGSYALITGAVPPEVRQIIQDVYNSDENRYGEIISILLISATGAEGLDLKNVRYIILLEPYWKDLRHSQVFFRGARTDSHIRLEPGEKNVQPYVLLAVEPYSAVSRSHSGLRNDEGVGDDSGLGPAEQSTDEELYTSALRDQDAINSYLTAIQGASIECSLNGGIGCRVCVPSDAPLFTADIAKDVRMPDPCVQAAQEKVVAREITVGDVTYAYAPDTHSVHGFAVYEYAADIGAHRRLKESDERFDGAIEAIKKAEGVETEEYLDLSALGGGSADEWLHRVRI